MDGTNRFWLFWWLAFFAFVALMYAVWTAGRVWGH